MVLKRIALVTPFHGKSAPALRNVINNAVLTHHLDASWKAPSTNNTQELISYIDELCNEHGLVQDPSQPMALIKNPRHHSMAHIATSINDGEYWLQKATPQQKQQMQDSVKKALTSPHMGPGKVDLQTLRAVLKRDHGVDLQGSAIQTVTEGLGWKMDRGGYINPRTNPKPFARSPSAPAKPSGPSTSPAAPPGKRVIPKGEDLVPRPNFHDVRSLPSSDPNYNKLYKENIQMNNQWKVDVRDMQNRMRKDPSYNPTPLTKEQRNSPDTHGPQKRDPNTGQFI